jgi:hypothetical protein
VGLLSGAHGSPVRHTYAHRQPYADGDADPDAKGDGDAHAHINAIADPDPKGDCHDHAVAYCYAYLYAYLYPYPTAYTRWCLSYGAGAHLDVSLRLRTSCRR